MLSRSVLSGALLASLGLFAACELQPAPPTPAASPTTPPPTPMAPTPTEILDAGVARMDARPPVVLTPECLEIGTHIAGVIIQSAEPSQRTVFEAERDRIVRATGEVCTTQQWSKPALECYRRATTQPALKTCEAKFPSQPQTRDMPQPPSGTGPAQPANPDAPGGQRAEPGAPGAPAVAPPRAGAGGAAAPRAGAGSAAAPRAGAGSAAAPRPGAAAPRPGAAAPRPSSGSAAPRPGAGSAAPRPAGGGLMPPRAGAGSGSAR